MSDPRTQTDRIQALRAYQLPDTLPKEAIDRITRLACLMCQTPIARVTLLEENRQWGKSTVSMSTGEIPGQVAFCQYVMAAGVPLEVPDVTRDQRFNQHPLVTGDPSIRFYAGYPLTDPEGYVLGSLCVLDQQPRQLSSHQHQALELLSHTVIDLIPDRRQQQVSQLFEQTGDPMALVSRAGYFKAVNQVFERELGWRADELLGTHLAAWVHPQDRAITQQLGERVTSEPVALTHRFRRPDGTYRHLHWVLSPQPDTDNRLAIIRDVTPRKQQEDALRQAQQQLRQTNQALEQRVAERTKELSSLHQRFQLAVEGARMGVWSFDLTRDELTWNDTLYQLCGLVNTGQPLGVADYERLIHPEDLPAYRARHRQPQVNQALTNQQRIIRPDGQIRWLELHGIRLDNAAGEAIGSVGVVQDITERKAAEAALRTSEERFQEIASHVGEIFWVQEGQSQRFLYVNPAYETMSGLRCADLYADPRDLLRFVVAQDHPRLLAVFQDSGANTQFEFRVHHRDGQVHWLQARLVAVSDESGRVLRRIGVATDITAAREKEQLLEASLHNERRLRDHQAHFITTASHMFRTPLTAMATSLELARLYLDRLPASSASEPIRRHLSAITGKIDALDGLIRDTLCLDSVPAGPSALGWRAIDLVGLSAALIEAQFGSYARQGRSVAVEVVGPPVPVAGDERLLESVLMHLLRNAFTYSVGSPRLQLRYGTSAVVVQVSDAGIGIPEEDQPYIFDRFFRARNAGDFQGLGLGLAICQEQVGALGGRLWVESSEGAGTTLSFSLVLWPPEEVPVYQELHTLINKVERTG